MFVIDSSNRVAVHGSATAAQAAAGRVRFASEQQLLAVTAGWPAARLVAIWNQLSGIQPVNKFTDRTTAVRRIWREVQVLTPGKTTKSDLIASLLMRPTGATIEQISEVTGWQPHSVRGFISGLAKKPGVRVLSEKREGVRVYQIR